ncbi:MAG TPA: hypothetical protein VK629_11550 [Steroidobacteraceae bacterium]|nr:hypothetical protein [Steroidobacteraceae bacterium]
MSLTSYRASVAYYSQSEQFIIFGKGHEESLRMLEEERRPELEEWIAQHFAYSEPPASNQWILDELEKNGHVEHASRLRRKLARLDHFTQNGTDPAEVEDIRDDIREFREMIFGGPAPKLRAPHSIPPAVAALLHRTDVNSRFDPIRLALEHDVLKASTLDRAPDAYGRRRFVPFNQMDSDIRPSDDPEEVNRIENQTSALMRRLRIARFGLIREFELCRFTYGFTRMASTPTLEAHQKQMPVRLNLFPKIHNRNGDSVHPVYVLTQANEALYIQLDPAAVYAWLQRVGATQGIEWTAGDRKPLSAHLLERARVFPRFMDNVTEDAPSAYVYAFTLLHTLAHGFMKAISTVSGLELGSMSEYLFPTDLAFVVYRSGTTMDLGNLSSLWRNENTRFLGTMLEPRTWMCNSGTLCGEKGAACPDCILVPETSCIAQNRLLSRAVVGGGRAPLEDVRETIISGFLESP